MIIWYQETNSAHSAKGNDQKETRKEKKKISGGLSLSLKSFSASERKINCSTEGYKLGEVIDSSLFTHQKDELVNSVIRHE